jgi:hypothetical protein
MDEVFILCVFPLRWLVALGGTLRVVAAGEEPHFLEYEISNTRLRFRMGRALSLAFSSLPLILHCKRPQKSL